MPEIWKDVLGFEGFYEVSNTGKVRSVIRIDSKGLPRGGHPMKIGINCRSNYPVVKLSKDGKSKLCKVHILVLEAFVSSRPVGMMGLHNDDIKENCNLDNLRWGTGSENIADKFKNDRIAKGERNGGRKLTETQVRVIKSLMGTKSDRALAIDFGVTKSTIIFIRTGRSWKHVR